jgi:prepilin-type N-terminal cleavage/methylation domain-containing protein
MKLKQINQKGFTMIELVIVIAVLSILAAFALPRFANFTNEASNATSESIAGAINASLGVIKTQKHARGSFIPQRFDIDNNPETIDDVIYLEGNGNIRMSNPNNVCTNLLNVLLPNSTGLNIVTLVPSTSCLITGRGINVYLTTTGASTVAP